jgi:two-component system, cell cycle response regulator
MSCSAASPTGGRAVRLLPVPDDLRRIPRVITPADILNGKILVVDDQELTARMVTEMLLEAGYTAATFTTNSSEVRELHRKNRYDLILLDLQMPGMNGFHVMQQLSAIEYDAYLPVLVMTAEPSHKLHALKAGAKDFISKPFDPDEALTRIRNMLEVRLLHDEARNSARSLEAMAHHDALTGLANRRLLTDRTSAALANARRNNSSMAIVYLDLDGFKEVNDRLGHGVGDILLKMVAGRLTAAVREEDTVGRLGGDEFMIALWNAGRIDNVATVAAKLIKSVSMPYVIEGHTVSVTASAGIGIYPAHGADAGTLMTRADAALYAAKRAGKNAFRIAEQPGALLD